MSKFVYKKGSAVTLSGEEALTDAAETAEKTESPAEGAPPPEGTDATHGDAAQPVSESAADDYGDEDFDKDKLVK